MLTRALIFTELSKSGIVLLVLISVFAGYFLGLRISSHPELNSAALGTTLLGILLLASGSSALNQFQEQKLDSLMARTRNRPLPSGRLNGNHAMTFIGLAFGTGTLLLSAISLKLVLLGWLAVLFYNGLYTLWWKPHWSHAAVPGAIPGALPVLMGYVAASGEICTRGGIYLFLLLYYWQMPHFWALALRFRADYAQGGVPTLPVTHGRDATVFEILIWCLGYVAVALMAPLFLDLHGIYAAITLLTAFKVLLELDKFCRGSAEEHWLGFFLWINFSLILLLAGAVLDSSFHTD